MQRPNTPDRHAEPARARPRLALPVTAAVLLTLTACTTNPPPPTTQPSTQLLDECVTNNQTAVDYANQTGLTGVNVSIYDTNNDASTPTGGPGCMTTHERAFIRALANTQAQGIANTTKLQAIINTYPRVGPLAVAAIQEDAKQYQIDKQYDPTLTFLPNNRIGWIPLNTASDTSLPGQDVADPTWNPTNYRPTNYPLDPNLHDIGRVDWSIPIGTTSTFLSTFAGYTQCSATEDGQLQGLDFIYNTTFGQPKPTIPIRNASLTGATLAKITVNQLPSSAGGTYSDADILLTQDIHPDDQANLIAVRQVKWVYTHVMPPNNTNPNFITSDFPNTTGQHLAYNTHFADASTFHEGSYLLDLTISTDTNINFGFHDPAQGYVLDPLASKYYPKTIAPTPTQPRYLNNLIYAPCGLGVALPNQP